METHRLFFDQKLNEYTAHPVFNQAIEHGLHVTLHELVKPPLPLTRALGELVLRNLSSISLNEPVDRMMALEDTIALLEQLRRTDRNVAREAEELANNLTFQYRFLQ
jgi:hypothetical protein